MAGFPREEQKLLAIMVGGHRRKPAIEEADDLAAPWDKRAPAMTLMLRLAVLLQSRPQHRWRCPPSSWRRARDSLEMRFPPGWLDDHPLTGADLHVEIEQLKTVGFPSAGLQREVAGAITARRSARCPPHSAQARRPVRCSPQQCHARNAR